MSEAPELLPCPFCGGVHLKPYKGHHNSYVECHGCGAYGPDMPAGDWNTRADLPATDEQALANPKVQALVEALGKAAERLDASLFTNAEHAQAREIIRAALAALGLDAGEGRT